MEVDEALGRWMDGKMSIKEVFLVTGLRSLQALYQEFQHEKRDLDNESEFYLMTTEKAEQEELEQEAWFIWQHLLQERPEYLETCIRALLAAKQKRMQAIGSRMRKSA